MTDYLYRVRITAYPDGAVESHGHPDEETMVPVPGWSPTGWKPEGNYVQILGTAEFVWPTTNKQYRSRSTAKKRAQLLESFGATVVIERSNEITWPWGVSTDEVDLVAPSVAVRPTHDLGLTTFTSFKEDLLRQARSQARRKRPTK